MHGLVNHAVYCFIRDTAGPEVWSAIAQAQDLPAQGFEAMFQYDDSVTERLLRGATVELGKPRDTLLEDIGTYLVSHPNVESLRRLLRFGGDSFVDFMYSVDDLPRRARLALPDLELPTFEVIEWQEGRFRISCHWHVAGFGHVLVGILRTMADDYGTLVFLEHEGGEDGTELVSVQVLQTAFTEGRPFDLAVGGLP